MSGSLFVSFVVAAAVWGGGASGVRDDTHIREAARLAVEASPHFTIFDDVKIEAANSVIALTGKVTTSEKKAALGRAVATVAGTHVVENRLAVLPPSPGDRALRERIARAIYGHPAFWHYSLMPSPSIHILVEGGQVTLTGHVRSDGDRALARALATQAGATPAVADLFIEPEPKEMRR
jgi:osmotically-inducible protein OsmY